MYCVAKLRSLVFVFIIVTKFQDFVDGSPQVPCYYIFGDSLVDNGNNNALPTLSKADYFPYGIDVPQLPKGRFTNGFTQVDFIARLLRFVQLIPPFASTEGQTTEEGVNYGSGSAGILDNSGTNLGARISFREQIWNHKTTIARLSITRGINQTSNLLQRCLYTVNIGSNDYINNYFLPGSLSRLFIPPDQYATSLIHQYATRIKELRRTGARKFALFGLGLIGFTPYEMKQCGENGSCVEEMNNAVQMFNTKLKSLVDQLNQEFPDSKFTYIDSVRISSAAAPELGLQVSNESWCPTNQYGLCQRNTNIASINKPSRELYYFFDDFHPTQVVNNFTAGRAYTGADLAASPFSISTLVSGS